MINNDKNYEIQNSKDLYINYGLIPTINQNANIPKENIIIQTIQTVVPPTGNKSVKIDIVNKAMKSICKITVHYNDKTYFGTGFFMKVSDKLKYLITNYHVLNPELMKNSFQIDIYNKKNIKLNFDDIKFMKSPIDITALKLKDSDEIYSSIEFLNYDSNYLQQGYNIYNGIDVFSVEHPFGNESTCACGKIIAFNGFEFGHNIDINTGSSGCPIILNNNDINLLQVIGIHKNWDKTKGTKSGTFIGELINEINKDLKNIKRERDNYIIAEIYIKDENVNNNIRIINSYEEIYKNCKLENELRNEKEIKECQIKINDEIIPFNYCYKFKNKGKSIIKYTFKNFLTSTIYMFYECSSLTSIDLSNFNTQNVTDMEYMFSKCSSLKYIDLSNFNTQKVTNMRCMFNKCSSLKHIDLSNFNTANVTNMVYMFEECSSLASIDLSNFNTQNVTDMGYMFNKCSSLKQIDLSNFNIQKVTNMRCMFNECSSLTTIDLSNFNAQKDIDMWSMFNKCSSLTSINLSNFHAQNITNMAFFFCDCSSLKFIDFTNFYAQKIECMAEMFDGCSSLKSIDLSNFNNQIFGSMNNMFFGCSSLTDINLSKLNTQNICSMSGMFSGCSSLTDLNIFNFNTQNVKDMRCMFDSCSSLTYLNLSNFNTQKVENMRYKFNQCSSLAYLDLSNFNTQNVTDMTCMFCNCSSLTYLNISNFNTKNVRSSGCIYSSNMDFMFGGCSSLIKKNVIVKDNRIIKQLKEDDTS